MSIRSTTEFVNSRPVITEHATCEGCGTSLDSDPGASIMKAMATAKWWSSQPVGFVRTLTWCPACGKAEDDRLNAEDVAPASIEKLHRAP